MSIRMMAVEFKNRGIWYWIKQRNFIKSFGHFMGKKINEKDGRRNKNHGFIPRSPSAATYILPIFQVTSRHCWWLSDSSPPWWGWRRWIVLHYSVVRRTIWSFLIGSKNFNSMSILKKHETSKRIRLKWVPQLTRLPKIRILLLSSRCCSKRRKRSISHAGGAFQPWGGIKWKLFVDKFRYLKSLFYANSFLVDKQEVDL